MIDWVMDTREADAVWQSVNHTKVNTLGQEISLTSHLLPLTSFEIAYCHLHQNKNEAEYLQSQYSLEYLRHKVTAQVTARLTEKLEVRIGYRYQDRMGSYTDTQGTVKNYHPYSVLDGKVTWKEETYAIYVEGNNLTSHRYVDYGNVPQPGAWVTAGVKVSLY
jgi:iron complex outermembrane receptor protein